MEYVTKETPHGIGNPNELSFNLKLYVKSKFKPPLAAFFAKDKLHKFRDMIAELHEMLPQVPSFNIDKLQRLILSSLRNNSNIILLNADKNQGLVTMDRTTYMTGMLEHCCNSKYNTILSKVQAHKEMEEASAKIKAIVLKYQDDIPDNKQIYFKQSFEQKHRIPQLYGAPKLHKGKNKEGKWKF